MSVTFRMPQAPVMRIEPYPEEEPGYYEVVPVEPFVEINLANSNFTELMPYIDPEWDGRDYGTISAERCAQLYRNVFIVLNRDSLASTLIKPDVRDGNILTCGRDMDYVTRRLTEFLKLFMVAKANGFEVVYA